MTIAEQLLLDLSLGPAVLVQVTAQRGSAPRGAGAWMAVFADHCIGSIGGGEVEWQAMQQARAWLTGRGAAPQPRYTLGPTLGQCCGGVLELDFERVDRSDLPRLRQWLQTQQCAWPTVAIFGAGHVGTALVRVLQGLSLQVQWFDDRPEVFRASMSAQVQCQTIAPLSDRVAALPVGTQVLVMSHSHAQDLEIVAACLERQRQHAAFGAIGLIGSKSKWAAFRHALRGRGFADDELARVQCPIGLPGIAGKEPATIAVSVAAQILLALNQTQATTPRPAPDEPAAGRTGA